MNLFGGEYGLLYEVFGGWEGVVVRGWRWFLFFFMICGVYIFVWVWW